jgi:cardiolipin synthase A/B
VAELTTGPPGMALAAPTRADLEYAWDGRSMRRGNSAAALVDGAQAFPAMLAAIGAAKKSVHLETYILRSDDVGHRFGDALVERARAGVAVRLLYDAIGSISVDPAYIEDLRSAGVQVVAYNPLKPWKRRFGLARLGRRDHRKILVVDGVLGFTGGLNIGEEYAPVSDGGGGWHDMHVELRGPVVLDLEASFRRIWIRAGGDEYPPAPDPARAVPSGGAALAMVLDNKELRGRLDIRRAYLHAISTARESICIENAYFIPDIGIRWALRRAVRRGVSVKIVVPAVSDVPAVQWASRYLYRWLLDHGVRIFAFPERMMHAKTAVIDGVWSTVGSYNLDYRSLFYNLEVVVEIIDRAFGTKLQEHFQHDLGRCTEILLPEWKQRPFWEKIVEWVFFRLKKWL